MPFIPYVDQEKCKGCEECLEICTADVFELREMKAVPLYPDRCLGCRSCTYVCEQEAITVEETRPELSDQCAALLRDIL